MRKRCAGEITVVFAVVVSVIIGLLLTIMESARTDGARLKTTIAANASIDSLFSQYHAPLWKEYRLLGLEQYSHEQLQDEMTAFLQPYMEAKNWYPMKVDSVDLNEIRCLTDENGAVFEEDVCAYMKDSLMMDSIKETVMSDFDFGILQAGSVAGISNTYSEYAKDAVKLEKRITNLQKVIRLQKESYLEAKARLEAYDGTGFIYQARVTIADLRQIQTVVEAYNTQAGKLEGKVRTSRSELDGEKTNGHLSEEVWGGLDEQVKGYESYAYEEGQRRSEISSLTARAERDIELLEDVIREAEEAMETIDTWEFTHEDDDDDDWDDWSGESFEDEDAPDFWDEDEDDDEDEGPDLEEIWGPVIAHLNRYDLIEPDVRGGIANEKLEAQLEGVKELLTGDILRLIIPADAKVSREPLKLDECPSSIYGGTFGGINLNVLKRAAVSEYIASHMNYFGRGIYDKRSKKGSGGCEIEYILFGKNNDHANLSAAALRLIEIRSGLNLVYLFTDKEKMTQVSKLAAEIAGAVAMPPLAIVITFLILSVWALAEAVVDVRELLKGNKVPFMHTKKSFKLSLEGMMNLNAGNIATAGSSGAGDAAGGTGGSAEGGKGSGLDYFGYLRLLLFFQQGSGVDYRCMDIIQMNIRNTQSDFRIDRLVYSLDTTVNVRAAHLFSLFGFVRDYVSVPESFYIIPVDTSYSY